MSDNTSDSNVDGSANAVQEERRIPVRLWPAWVILICEACGLFLPRLIIPGERAVFLAAFFGPVLGTLAFQIWWLAASRTPWRIRGLVLLGFIALCAAVGFVMDRSMVVPLVIYMIPLATAVWTIVLATTPTWSWYRRSFGVLLGIFLVFSVVPLLRLEGADGSFNLNLVWRWQPRQEDAALEALREYEASMSKGTPTDEDAAVVVSSSDWAEFRGPRRDSRLAGVQIETDWSTNGPVELWRRPVGPGWSSFAIVGTRAFTQEQRGDDEAVVCYDTGTGQELWAHLDRVKFDEAMGGVGPRATPTVADDRLYAMGGMGTLNCLDSATGRVVWSADVPADAGAKIPQWGFASSPLVVGDLVVVYAGAKNAGMVAYDRQSGELAWTCPAGTHSYSSPHLATVGDNNLVLMMSNAGLTAVEPSSGSFVWKYDWESADDARIIQPLVLDDGDILVGTGYGLGTHRVSAKKTGTGWEVRTVWQSRNLKPYFNDFVCHEGHIYGFDDKIMTCIDPESGDRVWKGGRYGYGQLLLLVDQSVLLVVSERGDVALVEAKPDGYKELSKTHAMDGKTWNHPVIAYGKLFVRNSEEAVCYELPMKARPNIEPMVPEEE